MPQSRTGGEWWRPGRLAGMQWAALVLMIVGLLFGGASRDNELQVAITTIAGLIVALIALDTLIRRRGLKDVALPLAVIGALLLVPIIQIIPLPADLWVALPGRARLAEVLAQAGAASSWRPISLTPDISRTAITYIVPGVAMFLATLSLDSRSRTQLGLLVMVAAAVNVLLGMGQLAAGSESLLRPYETTNVDSGVGFFANKNHYAALLLSALPITALWYAQAPFERRTRAIACLALVVLITAGLGAARSRAGVLLFLPAIVGAALIVWRGRAGPGGQNPLVALGATGVGLAAVAMVLTLGAAGIFSRFDTAPDLRFQTAPIVAAKAIENLPFGTGLGSFDTIYRASEPTALVRESYFNHAHNDYLELFLETGLLGLIPLALFLFWWLSSSYRVWKQPAAEGWINQARGGAVVLGLILVHSLVDYPLRTQAMMIIFGFSAALLIRPTNEPERVVRRRVRLRDEQGAEAASMHA